MHEQYNLYPYWDTNTYCTRELFEEIVESGDLRKVWSYASLQRAERKNNLTLLDIYQVCLTHCPVCNNWLDYGLGKNNHSKNDYNTPSLDKLIPGESGGEYIKENIWVICERCNRLKNSAHGAEDAARLTVLASIIKDPNQAKILVENMKK